MEVDRTPRNYLKAEDVDQLARQNVQLMAELWIVKDRLALLETLLVESGVLEPEALDRTVPEGRLAETLERERERFIRRVVGFAPGERTLENLKALGAEAGAGPEHSRD